MTSASVQSSVDTRPRPLFTNAKYRRFVFRRMLDAAVWLIFGLYNCASNKRCGPGANPPGGICRPEILRKAACDHSGWAS